MNFLLYLLTKDSKFCNGRFCQYPHEKDYAEGNLINNMYEVGLLGLYEKSELKFEKIYDDFLGSVNSQGGQKEAKSVEVSEERKCRLEKMSEDEFEELKKRLVKNCPKKKDCHSCSIDKGDCPLLNPWKKEGDGYWHSYSLLGEYLPDLKKVVLYVNNIDDACGKPTYNGVLSTYVHELFHAYFHYVTEQKKAKHNYIREVEEAITEFSSLAFLRVKKKSDDDKWSEIFEWTKKSIGEKQKTVGDLPAYGFGRYLFDNIPEDEAFEWINKYAERLGYIDEEDELVKQYKQMVCPCYPSEPGQCMELLRRILFETNNKPIQPRKVKKPADGTDSLVLVDYKPAYDSFGWKGEIHIEYDRCTDEFNYCNGFMGRWDLSSEDIARIKAFLQDENNLRDFFDDRKAYSMEEAIRTEHYRAYTLHIKWKGKDKTISVGFGSTIPFKHPFY